MTDALAALRGIPRLRLAHLPTALEPMLRLGAALNVASLYVKRDDCTGLGLGGNKIRKLEFNLAAAQNMGADVIVCGGVVQSNAARQVAAACAKLGLECHLGIMSLRAGADCFELLRDGREVRGNVVAIQVPSEACAESCRPVRLSAGGR